MEQTTNPVETLQSGPVTQRIASDIYPFIPDYITFKKRLISEIEEVVRRYETKRAKEENALHTMSPLRRIFAGKKPDHHLALEFIHYVRKPMEQARRMRAEIEAAEMILTNTRPNDLVIIPDDFDVFIAKTREIIS